MSLIIPEMQCQEMAYTLGKHLDIPTINVDTCIVEALCTSQCYAKVMMLAAMNEMYDLTRRNNTKENTDDLEDTEGWLVLLISGTPLICLIDTTRVNTVNYRYIILVTFTVGYKLPPTINKIFVPQASVDFKRTR